MTEQYYTADPTCESRPASCALNYRGHALRFTTDAGCLAYLDGRQFRVEKVDFVEEYFG